LGQIVADDFVSPLYQGPGQIFLGFRILISACLHDRTDHLVGESPDDPDRPKCIGRQHPLESGIGVFGAPSLRLEEITFESSDGWIFGVFDMPPGPVPYPK